MVFIKEENRHVEVSNMSTAAVGLAVTAWLLMPLRSHEAAAQSRPLHINAVNLDIVSGQIDKFLTLLKGNGAAAVKEPGCREFNITVAQNDPNHVFIFEVYDSAPPRWRLIARPTISRNTPRKPRTLWPSAMSEPSHRLQ